MKRLFSIFMISALVGCAGRLSDTRVDINKSEENKIAELEKTVARQKEEIEQLRSKQATESKDDPIIMALRQNWKCCSKVTIKITDQVVRIYFDNVMNMIGFLESDTEKRARQDLTVFLEQTGYETGTIEYYTSSEFPEAVFSISGSLSDVKTMRYH